MGTFVTAKPHVPLPADRVDANPPSGLRTEVDASHINSTQSAVNDLYTHVSGRVNALDYGADPTGATDSTAALQLAINQFSANTSTGGTPNGSGILYVPPGVYLISSTLEYVGSPAYSFQLLGAGEGQGSALGTTFRWTGANTGESRVFRIQGAWHLKLEDFSVDCNGRAKYGIQVEPFEKTIVAGSPPTNYVGTSFCTYERVSVGGYRHEDGASGWLVGYIPAECPAAAGEGLQCDDQTWVKCSTGADYVGDSYELSGWRVMQGDNVKNLNWTAGQLVGGRYGIKFEAVAAGSCRVQNVFGGGFKGIPGSADHAGALVYGGGEHLQLVSCGLEGTTDVRLVADAGGFNGSNYGTWLLEDCYFAGPAPFDDYTIRVSGEVTLNRCDFGNSRTGSSPAKLAFNIVDANGSHSKATIRDCQFRNITDYTAVPAFDWNGNHMVMDEYSIGAGVNLDASGNTAWNSGTEIRLSDSVARPAEMVRAKLKLSQSGQLESGASFVVNGLENGYVARSNHVYAGWQTAAASLSSKVTSIPVPPGAYGVWLKRVVVDVTTLIAAGGPTISFKLGTSNGGNELLLSKVLSGTLPKTAGRVTADLGATMTAETLGATLTSSTDVYLTLTASSGNLSALTAGAWSIRYFYEVLW